MKHNSELFFFHYLSISFYQLIDFEKWLDRRRLSEKFEKELTERKKEEEKKMRKRETSEHSSHSERKNSLENRNQQDKNSSKRYVMHGYIK